MRPDQGDKRSMQEQIAESMEEFQRGAQYSALMEQISLLDIESKIHFRRTLRNRRLVLLSLALSAAAFLVSIFHSVWW